jgi:4-amino-4-deoxy-L-arabinose transferase-like glycosyltransferase
MQLAVGIALGQPWIVNAAFAALTVALTYRIGREGFGARRGETAGAIAAALVAFSPAALLLNATLMGHTAALFATALFILALLRLDRGGRVWRWAALGGIALGLLALNRPLTAVAVGTPGALWALARLARRFPVHNLRPALAALRPYAALAALALALAALIPVYNDQAVGDPFANLYTLVWEYDRVGFGPCCGRSGHTLEKGVRHMRFDLSLTAADLFGWTQPVTDASGQVDPALVDHWLNQADYLPIVGWSWVLLPVGLLTAFGWKRGIAMAGWIAAGVGLLALPFAHPRAPTEPAVGYLIVAALFLWVNAPVLLFRDRARGVAALLVAVALGLIVLQLAYWIGSQRYSTRYYYEGLISAALLTALPLAALHERLRARRGRWIVPLGVSALLMYSLFAYSLPRIGVLRGFNLISRDLIVEVERRRSADRPVLVIVNGEDVRWRAYGALMAQTSPYLDGPIVAARANSAAEREAILARFPDRQVIEMDGAENTAVFRDAGG